MACAQLLLPDRQCLDQRFFRLAVSSLQAIRYREIVEEVRLLQTFVTGSPLNDIEPALIEALRLVVSALGLIGEGQAFRMKATSGLSAPAAFSAIASACFSNSSALSSLPCNRFRIPMLLRVLATSKLPA
jgi:hypothetical protein